MKKVLVISTSPRQGGNSGILAGEFAQGAREAGHQVEVISLRGQNIAFCRGCMACQKTRRCAIDDDAVAIVKKMGEAEAIAFATPIYYYGMSGQMKTLLDRANPLYDSDYAFRDIYLLTASTEEAASAASGAIDGLNGWVACFERANLKGVVRGGGASDPGDIRRNEAALKAAHEMGKNV